MNIIKFLGKNRDEKSMFHTRQENELVNAFVALGVVLSIFLFPLPVFGILAVLSWVFLTILFFKRGYAPFSTLLVGVITIVLIAYQGFITVDYINELSGQYDHVLITPEKGEYEVMHTIDIILQNEEDVFQVYYQFSRSRVYHAEDWVYLDNNFITTEGLPRDSYYLIVRVDLNDGINEYYTTGRYYVE